MKFLRKLVCVRRSLRRTYARFQAIAMIPVLVVLWVIGCIATYAKVFRYWNYIPANTFDRSLESDAGAYQFFPGWLYRRYDRNMVRRRNAAKAKEEILLGSDRLSAYDRYMLESFLGHPVDPRL